MSKDKWVWMPHAGHFCLASHCRFKLNTYVNGYIISTVGECVPDSQIQEILAETDNIKLKGKGDDRERDFIKKHGYQEIGIGRTYETMVFKGIKIKNKCCPYVMEAPNEIETAGYNTPEDAYKGHLELCEKYDKLK